MDPIPGCIRSADGTTIAYERSGSGPPLILVDAAGHYREFGMRPLAKLLMADFTVVAYDRRGRGESTDTLPYAVEREVEDLGALIDEVGGSALVYTVSSGGLLGLQAAASGLAITKLAMFEPPITADGQRAVAREFTTKLAGLVAADRHEDAAELFLTSIGVPAEILTGMRNDSFWAAFVGIAHTLVYDCTISDATSLEVVAAVPVPALVIDSEGSTGELTDWAAAIVGALPNGQRRSVAGEWHGASDEDIAALLADFFRT